MKLWNELPNDEVEGSLSVKFGNLGMGLALVAAAVKEGRKLEESDQE